MDLERNLSALLSLKNDYLFQVEQENPDHGETLKFYNELLDDLSREASKLGLRELITNENFKHCLKELNGNTLSKFIYFFVSGTAMNITVLEPIDQFHKLDP